MKMEKNTWKLYLVFDIYKNLFKVQPKILKYTFIIHVYQTGTRESEKMMLNVKYAR